MTSCSPQSSNAIIQCVMTLDFCAKPFPFSVMTIDFGVGPFKFGVMTLELSVEQL